MALKRSLAGARFHIPQPDRVVIAAGRNKLAIGREGHGIDGSAGTSTKKLVLTLPALLVQRLLPVPVTGRHGHYLDRGGLTGSEGSHPWP